MTTYSPRERKQLRAYLTLKKTRPSPLRSRAIGDKLLRAALSKGKEGRVIGYVLTDRGRTLCGLPPRARP